MNATTHAIPRRTVNLIGFATLLTRRLTEIRDEMGSDKFPRIVFIQSPESRGDVLIVLEHPEWSAKKALVYTAEGTFSGLSFWMDEQI